MVKLLSEIVKQFNVMYSWARCHSHFNCFSLYYSLICSIFFLHILLFFFCFLLLDSNKMSLFVCWLYFNIMHMREKMDKIRLASSCNMLCNIIANWRCSTQCHDVTEMQYKSVLHGCIALMYSCAYGTFTAEAENSLVCDRQHRK